MYDSPKNNELIPITRRCPKLRKKVLLRDSKIALRLALAWDSERNKDKVLSIYLNEYDKLSNERYWELMRSVWIICGSIEHAGTFRYLMQSKRTMKHYFSTPEEANKLRNMPNVFTVYRATNYVNDDGLSWTVSKKYAEGYRDMYQKKMILEQVIRKSDVFAFIERNNEREIIIL